MTPFDDPLSGEPNWKDLEVVLLVDPILLSITLAAADNLPVK